MALKANDLTGVRHWIIELDSYYNLPEAPTPEDIQKAVTSKTAGVLKRTAGDLIENRGEVHFVTRNPMLEGLFDSLGLPANTGKNAAKNLVTEAALPHLEHGLNGGHAMDAGETVLIACSEDIVQRFSDLGVRTVWIDQRKEDVTDEARTALAGRENVEQATIPDGVLFMISVGLEREYKERARARRQDQHELYGFDEYPVHGMN